MRIETLVVTIDRDDYSLPEQMNIQTDALIGNQCGCSSTEKLSVNGHSVVLFNTADRGVGRNRNLLLQNASADICILADDDMRFVDDYPHIAEHAFSECPDADILVFNLIEKKPRRYINKKNMRIRWYNYAKYGAARLAVRREALLKAGVCFSLSFGGGAKYGSGEDTIFLSDCVKKGLKIYAVPYALAEIDQDAVSTWFNGYNEKYFHDKGALYKRLHPVFWPVFMLRFLVKIIRKPESSISIFKAVKLMTSGAVSFRPETEE